MNEKDEILEHNRMYNDWEFAVDQFSSEIEEAYEILQSVSYKLSKYNHEIPAKDLLNYIL